MRASLQKRSTAVLCYFSAELFGVKIACFADTLPKFAVFGTRIVCFCFVVQGNKALASKHTRRLSDKGLS